MTADRYQSFALGQVELTGGEWLRRQRLVRDYLLSFNLDRLMHTFRRNAGLPSGAQPLGGWESEDGGIRGHFVGHFLSAAAKYHAGDDSDGQMMHIVDRIVENLSECARPDGYLSAFPDSQLDVLETKEFHGAWAPYYTLHKIMQGLVDAYRLADNDKALELAIGMAHYIAHRFERLGRWNIDNILRPVRLNPLNEYGGIGDSLYSLYELTGDQSILKTAQLFDRDYFVGNLMHGIDVLEDLHANTHLPVLAAALHRYRITEDIRYRSAVEYGYVFLLGRTFANGSNSSRAEHYTKRYGVSDRAEHWGTYGDLSRSLTGGECESCCAHNTERVVRELFELDGDPAKLAHVERLKFNAVLACLNPDNGLSAYHQPLGAGVRRLYSTAYDSFWCCTGTGIEAAASLQQGIWYRSLASEEMIEILLGMFIPSRLHWVDCRLDLELHANYPYDDHATVIVHQAGTNRLRLLLRSDRVQRVRFDTVPGMRDRVTVHDMGEFVAVEGVFHDGDVFDLDLGLDIAAEPLPGNDNRVAVLYGGIVLAAEGSDANVSQACRNAEGLRSLLVRENDSELRFTLHRNGDRRPLRLKPIYEVKQETYSVYLNADETHELVPEPWIPVTAGEN
ncbi:beta-L-arabinofuranosidase domain-containing protein [Bifidobacterium callitrichidarum]|nr:beta-L-arabinofuranosidase domain-containing protein [Bifidobacterium callitrichidarum]